MTFQSSCSTVTPEQSPRESVEHAEAGKGSAEAVRLRFLRHSGRIRRYLRPEVLVPLLVYSAISIWFVQNRYSRSDFPLDDAWIHQVYARSFATGHGFAYNPGHQETGSTSPLWVIAIAPAYWAEYLTTGGSVVAVKLIGWILGAAVVLGVIRLSQFLVHSRFVAAAAGSLMALEPRLLFSAFSGMETPLLVAIWVWMCVVLLRGQYVRFLLLLGLAPVARPEALLLLPLALLAVPGVMRQTRPLWLKLVTLLLPLLPQLLWSAVCLSISGRPLPNTFYVKSHGLELGLLQLAFAFVGLAYHGLPSLWAYPVGMLAFLSFCGLRRGRAVWQCGAVLLLVPVVYLLGVVSTRTMSLQGYYWTRWLDPATMILAVPFCIGFAYLGRPSSGETGSVGTPAAASGPDPREASDTRRKQLAWRITGITLAVLFVVLSIPRFRRTMCDRRSHLATDSRAISIINVQMGKWLHENTPPDAVIGVNDAGAIRYFGERKTIDLIGLNNFEIANGTLSPSDAVRQCDWLAVFSEWHPRATSAAYKGDFDVRHVIRIPLEEYTICPVEAQTVKVAMQRTR
jgi:hypothetical protein